MKKKTDGKVENPEWTAKDFKTAKPFDALPRTLREKLSSRGRGPQKAPTKEAISIRLSSDVLAGLRASGPRWQARADGALREWLAKEKKRTASKRAS